MKRFPALPTQRQLGRRTCSSAEPGGVPATVREGIRRELTAPANMKVALILPMRRFRMRFPPWRATLSSSVFVTTGIAHSSRLMSGCRLLQIMERKLQGRRISVVEVDRALGRRA
jgi:hypothetical protein